LGNLDLERRDFAAAERWYQRSLAIEEKHGNEHGAAITYGQLGIIAGLQSHFVESGRWLIRCIMAFANQHDSQGAERNVHNFLIFYRQASPDDQAKLRQIWEEAGLRPFPWGQDSLAAAREERIEGKPAKAGVFKLLIRRLLK
jgi:hypothetical protein